MSFRRYISRIRETLQGNRTARWANKRRQQPCAICFRPRLERLEDRILLSGSNPFQVLGENMGPLTNVQGNLTKSLNTPSHIPLLSKQNSSQNSGSSGILGRAYAQ